ncbi:MAG: RHS repeat-associated core domain-containing protein [Armatimonadota bacterium]|nr:MAG: RHS repeat-associated core domain-containing protein [Armatimonadota bacterium]
MQNTAHPYPFGLPADRLVGGAWGYVTEPSGLLHLGQRYYWPEIGRFIEKDPARDGMNWYAYALDNPVYWIDPEGLWEFGGQVFAGIGAGFYFGVDPCTGFFVKAKAGVGLGIGGGFLPTFDPHARSRGAEAGLADEGSFFGFDVGAAANALGRSLGSIGMAGGWASDPHGNLGRYPRKPRGPGPVPSYLTPPGGKFGDTYTANIGVTAALEGGFY